MYSVPYSRETIEFEIPDGMEVTVLKSKVIQPVDDSRQASDVPVRRARRLLQSYGQQIAALRLMARGVSPTVIRPLALVDEDTTRRFAREQDFPKFVNPCPSSSRSKRREIKKMLDQLYRDNKKVRGNIFRAMSHVNPDYLI